MHSVMTRHSLPCLLLGPDVDSDPIDHVCRPQFFSPSLQELFGPAFDPMSLPDFFPLEQRDRLGHFLADYQESLATQTFSLIAKELSIQFRQPQATPYITNLALFHFQISPQLKFR